MGNQTTLWVETPCEHGEQNPHPYPGKRISDLPYCAGGSRRIIDPENLPAEVVGASTDAAEAVFRVAGYKNKGLSILLDKAVEAALSAAFRTLGETQ